ncbi:hypothetical protein H8959_013103 [Pygathrix nigripes]
MADIRAQYDQLAQKNREELDKYWSQQIEESTTVVTTQSTEVGAAKTMLTELRCTVQFLEIELNSMRNLKASLENSLREDFNLGDALDSSNFMETIQKTTTCWIVDGKVVSETNDTKILRH